MASFGNTVQVNEQYVFNGSNVNGKLYSIRVKMLQHNIESNGAKLNTLLKSGLMSSSCARRIPTSSFTFCSSWTENSIFPILGFSLLTNFGALLFVSLMWNRKKESSYRCASPSPCCRQRKEQLHWKFKKNPQNKWVNLYQIYIILESEKQLYIHEY